MSYSNDFRECVLRNIDSGMSWDKASIVFSISRSSIYKWLKNHKNNGVVSDDPRKEYKPKKIDKSMLKMEIERTPDATLEELALKFNCWPQSIQKRCKKLGITRKKNHALRGEKRGKKAAVFGGD